MVIGFHVVRLVRVEYVLIVVILVSVAFTNVKDAVVAVEVGFGTVGLIFVIGIGSTVTVFVQGGISGGGNLPLQPLIPQNVQNPPHSSS